MTLSVTILGCGSSGGSPIPGIGWGRCDPDNVKNRRLRPSIMVQANGTQILFDTSPDLRQQLLNANITALDAIVYSHAHADHLHGIDDIRGLNRAMDRVITGYADKNTIKQIRQRFDYVLAPLPKGATRYFKPTLDMQEIRVGEKFSIRSIDILPIDQDHGYSHTLGFRMGDFAYSTDLMDMCSDSFEALKGIDTWMLGVFTDHPHPTHLHLSKALEWIKVIKPRRTVLTHLGPDLDFQTVSDGLPGGVELAYDGLQLIVE